jgi:hypothetical protein
MATPMWADFKAGASLTPSPVMATIWPSALRAFTRPSFCSGATRANTFTPRILRCSSAPVSEASSAPVITLALLSSPIFCAMLLAVPGKSPVIITTRIPAVWHSRTASGTAGRIGSARASNPANCNGSSCWLSGRAAGSIWALATPSTRNPALAMADTCVSTRAASSGAR